MSRKTSLCSVCIVAASFAVAGCNGAPGNSGGGGGAPGDAGAGAGTGGASAGTGGRAGSGGTGGGTSAGSGGAVGSGGASTSGSGGTTGAGGAGSGGATGSGGGGAGTGGTGGAAGRGGTGGAAGRGAGTGGAAGAGGAPSCGTPTPTTLKAAASCRGRLFGAALAASHLGESAYATAAREHNYVTAENEMKWGNIEPTRGSFSFGTADRIVTFAMQNGMKVKGHALVWGEQLPAWVGSITSATDLRSAMVSHIRGLLDHYRGKVEAWDVVNEAWLTDGRTGDGNPRLRDTVFSRVLGPTYIDEAFAAAREADPNVLLIYNDFANEGLSDKSTAIYNMVRDMKMRGVPIDGVGLQMHIGVNTNPTPADVATNLQRLADLGLKVYISEMDVNGCAGYTAEQTRTQYHDMVAVCVAQPACVAFTVWGVSDRYSWLNTNTEDSRCTGSQLPRPLLWDDNYGKKSAYTGVMDALLGR